MEDSLSSSVAPGLELHPNSAIELGSGLARRYVRNFPYAGDFIDDFHRSLSSAPLNGPIIQLDIPGWLRPADALKLYEVGYFSPGDILEFGTNRGLSAYILASAVKNSGRLNKVATMELNKDYTEVARKSLSAKGLADFTEFYTGDAADSCEQFARQGRTFGMAFVDHSHAYEHVLKSCDDVDRLLNVGALCIFHDYTDRRNTLSKGVGESGSEYGVYAGIQDGLSKRRFRFVGVYGCCGVFQKVA